ncbi:HAD family hydrolase [Anaerosinus gibii]|uniref:HAD family hydrolase n=1 Tax=Selenobaculum gibii TaxID=3054208 RepID=A0A9Y2ESK8_9FIRM|nr:HAD family hydrolase [Selenobaculum gbiensis]WIW70456.1 HAD family hydrolase [Selenobaculum gbiensis]
MVRLILTDMDGTLLDRHFRMPEGVDETISQLADRGVVFGAASGRQYYSLIKSFEKHVNEMLFVAENGTYVVYKKEEIFSNTLRRDYLNDVLKVAQQFPSLHVLVSGKKKAYYQSTNEVFLRELDKYYKEVQKVDNLLDLSGVDDEFLKVAMYDLDHGAEEKYHSFEHFRGQLQVAVSADCWLDVMNLGATKGAAVKHIQDALGISFEETMVFGDYMNDLEMMSSAYHSYAMENALDEVKKAARFIAPSNDKHGVLVTIKEKVLK